MPLIIAGTKDGLTICNPDGDATTGRWCAAPEIPDRCYTCCDPHTLAHHVAEGYREQTDEAGTVWRYGTCHRCAGVTK
jgi:hypothetical protein